MKKTDIKNLFIGIISSIAATFILSIFSITSSIFIIFTSNKIFAPQNIIMLISIITICILMLKIIFIDKNRHRPYFPILTMAYEYRQIETELNFISREKFVYTTKYKITALKEIPSIKRSYWCTGDEIKGLPLVVSDSDNISDVELIKSYYDGRKELLIKFLIPLKKGQQIDFSLKYNLTDNKNKMEPFLRHTVKNPTEKIILRLVVPNNLVKNVVKCVYADMESSIIIAKPEQLKASFHNDVFSIYEWKILKPNLLHLYKIVWKFKNEK